MSRDKKESFRRLAKSRMDQMEQIFKLMKNLANHYNYEFDKAQLDALVKQASGFVSDMKKSFDAGMVAMELPPRAEGDKPAKGRPRKLRIVSTTTAPPETPASVTKEIVEEAKTEIIRPKPVIDDTHVPDFLKRKA